jgi:hypothetical protein
VWTRSLQDGSAKRWQWYHEARLPAESPSDRAFARMSRSMQARFEGRDVSTGLVSGEAGYSRNREYTVAGTVAILPTSAALEAPDRAT